MFTQLAVVAIQYCQSFCHNYAWAIALLVVKKLSHVI